MEKKINFYLTVCSIPKENSYFLVANETLDSDFKNYLLENLDISNTEKNNILIVNNLNELNNYLDKNIHLLISPESYVWGYEAIIKINNNLDKHYCLINKVIKDDSEKYLEVNKDCISYLQNNAKLCIEEINLVKNQLSDKRSKDLYISLIENSFHDISCNYLDNVYKKIQYFEYINYQKDMIIINAGIEEGFELPYFDFLTQNTCEIYNIDPSGFNNLSSVSKQVINNSAPNRFHVINKILWDQESDSINIPVDSNGTVLCQYYNNNIHQMNTVSFPATTVDAIVELNKLKKVDLIKMDIEGGEPYALKGAMKTINYFRPQLAISIYHLANHYWEIPLYLMKELKNYKFYFGHYSPGRWEAILYAIPIEKL